MDLTRLNRSSALAVPLVAALLLALPVSLIHAQEGAATAAPPADDAWLWLEDVTAEPSLDWVRARNAESTAELTDEAFEATRDGDRSD